MHKQWVQKCIHEINIAQLNVWGLTAHTWDTTIYTSVLPLRSVLSKADSIQQLDLLSKD